MVSSLRFNYMFPIPKGFTSVRSISGEPDRAYRALLSQELRYCIQNQGAIQHLAERTYKRVLLGKDQGLVANSCDFSLLEQKCVEYSAIQEKKTELAEKHPATDQTAKVSMKDRFAAAQAEADRRAAGAAPAPQKSKDDPER